MDPQAASFQNNIMNIGTISGTSQILNKEDSLDHFNSKTDLTPPPVN